jgi:CTP:molybdopterin cytidylyltransferase MocA
MNLPAPFDSDLKVLIAAGGDALPSEPDSGRSGGPLSGKAFLKLRDRLVIEYVLDFLRECGLGRPWVVAHERNLARIPARHAFVPVAQRAGAGFFENLLAGSAALSAAPGEPVLIVFGDHPLNSRAALQFFLSRCAELLDQADFFHALALKESYRAYCRWFGRTSVHMREMSGRASGLTLVVPSRLHGVSKLQALYEVRKLERPGAFLHLLAHLTRWLGADAPRSVFDSLVMYVAKEFEKAGRARWPGAPAARRIESLLASTLPVARMQRYAARVLGAERGVRFIPVPHGGIGIDVDFANELTTLEGHWDALTEISAREDEAIQRTTLIAPAAGELHDGSQPPLAQPGVRRMKQM